MVDFNTAKYDLSISKAQFDKLDKLDGNQDGQISQSIYTKAKEIRNQDSVQDLQASETSNKNDTSVESQIREIVRNTTTRWFAFSDEISETYPRGWDWENVSLLSDKEICEFKKLSTQLADHIAKNGTMDGFSYNALPDEVEIEAVNYEYLYDNGSNDSVHMVDGCIENCKCADGIKVVIEYSKNGESGTLTITSDTAVQGNYPEGSSAYILEQNGAKEFGI